MCYKEYVGTTYKLGGCYTPSTADTNYNDYLKESYRILNYDGFIYIAEPSSSYDNPEELKTIITNHNFKLVGDIENRGKFIYIIGTKN